jgi:GT2 family glycosyltransferase
MSELPIASVIVLNFNGMKYLEQCFASLDALNYPKDHLEVIMGDNASTDDSVAYVQRRYPWVRVIQFAKNQGFCKPNNVCAESARGEYVVFLNNDTFVEKDWLKNLVDGALSEPGIVSCASKILFPQFAGGKAIHAAGGAIFPSGAGLYEGYWDTDCGQAIYSSRRYTGFGCGAGVLFKKNFFVETGGFDPYYFYSIEEHDIGYRAWLFGHKVIYVPDAVMYHYMGSTGFSGSGVTPAIEYLMTRNKLYFILKNFELSTAIKGFCFLLLFSFSKILYAAGHGNLNIVRAILKGYVVFFQDISKALDARRICRAGRKVHDRQLAHQGILVGVNEAVRRLRLTKRRMKEYLKYAHFDTKNSVSVVIDVDGEMIFRRT